MATMRKLAILAALSLLAATVWAQTPVEYPAAFGTNLAAADMGGSIYDMSSESDPDVASNLLDGCAEEGWHWEPLWSEERPYYVIVELAEVASIRTIVFTTDTALDGGGRPALVEVYAGVDDPYDLEFIGEYGLDDEVQQVLDLGKPVKALWVQVTVLEDYGESGGELGELAIFGKASLAGFTGAEDADVVYLRDGTTLSGTAAAQAVDLAAYGVRIQVPASDLLWVEFGQEDGRLDRVALRNGDALSGIVSLAKVGLRLRSGLDLPLARERVAALGFKLKDLVEPAAGSIRLVLRSGDVLTGKLLNDKLVLVTGFGTVTLAIKDVVSVVRAEGTAVRVTLASSDELTGFLSEDPLRIDLDLGPVLAVHPELLAELGRIE